MGWPSTPSAERAKRAAARLLAATAFGVPALAAAHERWVPNEPRWPINRAYFQSMSGEVLLYSLAAAVAVFGLIVLWYLSAPPIVDKLTPVTASAIARESQRNVVSRAIRLAVRLALDGPVESAFMSRGLKAATFWFSKVPALVLGLGAYEGWLVMPSYPLRGDLGDGLRVLEGVMALWVLSGLLQRALGAAMFLVYAYLWVEYGIAAIDAIPVLASAFFYLFYDKQKGPWAVNARQLLGIRVSMGVGFFLLGLINKILLAELFIGVGDQHPEILIGPQTLVPGLTREAWSLTTALGEMVFGLLLLVGVYNRLTTLILACVFGNFIAVFGWNEVVHIYPISGFLLLFFRGPFGSALDGLVFKFNLALFRLFRRTPYRLVYGGAVGAVAAWAGGVLMFAPLVVITEVAPGLTGLAVPASYKPPPTVPPASEWDKISAAPASAAVPHGDHDPRHGGVVTMVGDTHVEILVRRDGTVMLFATDAVRAPIPVREVRGSVRVERPGFKRVVPLKADTSGGLIGDGPAPQLAADYTYDLVVRGARVSQSIAVPAGGTDTIKRPGGR